MHSTRLPAHLREIALANPDVQIKTSIAVDPLLLDDLQREANSIPIVRIMERVQFKHESEAQRYMRDVLVRANAKENLAANAEERKFDEAKNLVVQAFLCADESKRAAKATQALTLSPNCADAYIVLGKLENDLDKRIALLEKSVNIARSQFDLARFDDPNGFFWQKLSTRPYMRCRAALALALWEKGKQRIAVDHIKALLQLNPSDDQGLRFLLLSWLLDFDASDLSVDGYFKKYEHENSAFGRYPFALWNFVRYGDDKQSLKALRNALEANKFVPALMCGLVDTPNYKVKRVVRQSVPEAVAYHSLGRNAWQKTSGAMEWLKTNSASLLSSKTVLRKIETAEEWTLEGSWSGPMPMELTIGQRKVWR